MTRFDFCVAFVLKMETEYNKDGSVKVERDPNDPGGTTKYGIDQGSHSHVDVANLTKEGAAQIFHDTEWTKACCDKLNPNWDLIVFDTSVNPGLGFSIVTLQRVAGVKSDGFIGPKTIAAVNALGRDEMNDYLDKRESYYRARPETLSGHPFRSRFLDGWLDRVRQLREYAGLS